MKLRTIEPHLQGDKPILNENYNKILIEKAVLRDKLMHKEPSFLKNLALKIKNYNRRELICDYFKTAPNKN
jgi:hypothetical protein